MPNRIIKESICTSENLAILSAEAERLFYRLMTQCDDYGLMLANPSIVKNRCFQMTSDAIKEKQLVAWLSELEAAGLIFFYEVDGKQYLKYSNWEKHQQRRARNPKYPFPEPISENVISDDITCNHLPAYAPEKREARSEKREARSEKREAKSTPTHPSLDDVIAYCQERGNCIDPQRWHSYYSSNGWRVGKNPMKDWKAAVRTWEQTERRNASDANRGSHERPPGATPQPCEWDVSKILAKPEDYAHVIDDGEELPF